MTFVGQMVVGQNRCSFPEISRNLSDRLCSNENRFRDQMILWDNFSAEISWKISFVGQMVVGQNCCSTPEIFGILSDKKGKGGNGNLF